MALARQAALLLLLLLLLHMMHTEGLGGLAAPA
jgi:hypothetical protein